MIDPAALLHIVSSDSPCGENLEYDSVFGAMERAAVGKPEQQFGGTIIPAEEPNWRDVGKTASELLERTKDLRVAAVLARAELALFGLRPFALVLQLIRGYVEQFWDAVHPQLDPSDGNDPALRVNTLESLCDEDATLRLLRVSPLVSSRTVGRFNLRDVAIADGEVKAAADVKEPPDWARINAAFADCPTEELSANALAVKSSIEHVAEIQRVFAERVGGGGNGVNMDPLNSLLKTADKIYSEQLAKRGIKAEYQGSGEATAEAEVTVDTVQRLTGEVSSREDVVTALDKICDYYARYEPSSPLPLLLQRCKRLVPASFLEIIQDVIPEAMKQAEAIGGRRNETK